MTTIILWGIGVLLALLILLWLKKKFFAIIFFLFFIGAGPQLMETVENYISSIDPSAILEWIRSFTEWIG